jgi:hypothetical protein
VQKPSSRFPLQSIKLEVALDLLRHRGKPLRLCGQLELQSLIWFAGSTPIGYALPLRA